MQRHSETKLDKLDMALLKELEADGRQSTSGLAKKLGVSRNHVGKRLAQLLDSGVTRVVAFSDPAILGYRIFTMIGINVSPKRVNAAATRLKAFPSVHLVVTTAGRYHIVIYTLFKTSKELSDFITKELASVPGITSTETMVILEMHKMSFSYLASEHAITEGAPVKRKAASSKASS